MIGLRLALIALAVAGVLTVGCGDDDGDSSSDEVSTSSDMPGAEEAAAYQEEIADSSDEDQIASVGEEWAGLFGEGDEKMCGYLHPDLGGPSSCALYIQGSLTGSSVVQSSFSGATVESVEIQGDEALAEFSSGNTVKFAQADDAWWVIEAPKSAGGASKKVNQPQ